MLENGLISPGSFHHLKEVAQDSESLRSQLVSREIDETAGTGVWLAHVLDHLCLAWHQRNMEFDESMSLSQELYEEFSYRIPNWEGKFRLVEIPLSLVCEDNAVLRFHDTFNPQRCIDEVSQVIATFDSFLDLIIDRGGRLGDEELEHVLAAGLVRLCRAYHSSQCELSEDQLGEDVLAKVETSVPTWGWSAFSSLEPAYGPQ